MCFVKKPKINIAAEAPPEAPRRAQKDPDSSMLEDQRRRRNEGSNSQGTLLTGPGGVDQSQINTVLPSLLGQ